VNDGSLFRSAWRAVSHPKSFFETLNDEPRIGVAAALALASVTVGSILAALLLMRATGSDGWLPLLLGVPLLTVPYLAVICVLGGLVLMRPTGMDLRAFEIVAWAWLPSGLLAVTLLPIGLLAPWPTLLGGALFLLPPWHMWIVWRGVEVHAENAPRMAFGLYVAAVFGLPAALLTFTLAVLAKL